MTVIDLEEAKSNLERYAQGGKSSPHASRHCCYGPSAPAPSGVTSHPADIMSGRMLAVRERLWQMLDRTDRFLE